MNIKYQKTIIVSEEDYKTLLSGKHICINSVRRFINIKVEKKNSKDFLIAAVAQVGGIFNYTASIVMIDNK